MQDLTTRSVVKASMEAIIIRCGCGNPEKIHPRDESGQMLPCPTPRAFEDLGTIAYYNRNPFKQFWYDLRKMLGRRV